VCLGGVIAPCQHITQKPDRNVSHNTLVSIETVAMARSDLVLSYMSHMIIAV